LRDVHVVNTKLTKTPTTVDFSVNREGEVVLQRAQRGPVRKEAGDRFAAVCGRAEVKWRTRDLMRLLRDEP
jgi:hypothetical protein